MEATDLCVLCGKNPETLSHLYINCEYIKEVLRFFLDKTGNALLDKLGSKIGADIQIGDLIEVIEKIQHISQSWGLHWLALAAFS